MQHTNDRNPKRLIKKKAYPSYIPGYSPTTNKVFSVPGYCPTRGHSSMVPGYQPSKKEK